MKRTLRRLLPAALVLLLGAPGLAGAERPVASHDAAAHDAAAPSARGAVAMSVPGAVPGAASSAATAATSATTTAGSPEHTVAPTDRNSGGLRSAISRDGGVTLPEPAHGRGALRALGKRLPIAARLNQRSAEELRQLLSDDPTMWLSRSGKLFVKE